MFSQKEYTIIIVTFDSIARVDLVSERSVKTLQSNRVNRSAHAELGSSVKAGLNLGPQKCGRLFVLSDDFWSGQVSLSKEVVDAISPDQLEQAIALEAEVESGISPFESRLGFLPFASADERTTYQVTQAEATQLESIKAELPSWIKNIYGFSSVANCVSRSNDIDNLLAKNTPESSSEFAANWLTKYLFGASESAVILVPRPTWSEQQLKQVSMLIAIGVLLMCGVFQVMGNRRLAHANDALNELDSQAKQLRKALDIGAESAKNYQEARLQQIASQKAQAEHLAELHAHQVELAADQKRPAQLMRALAATANPGHWIQSIALNRDAVVISGIGVDGNSVTRLAEDLELELDSAAWRVHPAVMSIDESTRLIRFEMTLVPLQVGPGKVASIRKGVNHVF